jgi:signal transduction histidine kinase
MHLILGISLTGQLDASAARQRSRQIAALCGFNPNEQTRLSTMVSELARGGANPAHPGRIAFSLTGAPGRQALVIDFAGHAIAGDGSDVLAASRRFMERVEIDAGGRKVVLHKTCPGGATLDADAIARALKAPSTLSGAAALSDAHQRNRDLEASNQGFEARNGQLQLQADSLLTADRRKDEFLAILAHELRSPLSAVAMAGEMLQKNPGDPERVARVGQLITRQTAHMSRLIEDLLDVSRIVRNQVAIERLPVDLCEVVRTAAEQLLPAAQRRAHGLATHLPQTPVIVTGDRTRLIQVLGNLIGNAIRYTPEGGEIAVTLDEDADGVQLAVSDNGDGIGAGLLPHLFDLFVQGHQSSDSRNSGLGLGLTLVKALVEAHGGRVAAHSDGPGRGSRFEIRLPREAA